MREAAPPPPALPARLWVWWRRHWRSHLGTLLLVAAVFFGAQAWQTRGVPDTLPADVRVQLLRGDGSSHDLSLSEAVELMRTAFAGQPVALHLWAEWCPICQIEEDSITDLGRDWPVLTVAMQSGPATAVTQVQRQRGLPWVSRQFLRLWWSTPKGGCVRPPWVSPAESGCGCACGGPGWSDTCLERDCGCPSSDVSLRARVHD